MEIKSDVGHLTVSNFLTQPHCLSSVTLCGKIWKCFFSLPRRGHQLELEGIGPIQTSSIGTGLCGS